MVEKTKSSATKILDEALSTVSQEIQIAEKVTENGETKEKLEKKSKKAAAGKKDVAKVVRDSFTMPKSDYEKIVQLKLTCQNAGLHVKKSELLRAGLHLLEKLKIAQLKKAIEQIETIKTGRPKIE